MKQPRILLLLYLFSRISAQEEARRQKNLRSAAFRQSLLTTDTTLEDVDPSLRPTFPPSTSSDSDRANLQKQKVDEVIRERSGTSITANIGLKLEVSDARTTIEYSSSPDSQPIRIQFETSIGRSSPSDDEKLSDILPTVSSTWSRVLNIHPISGGLYPSSTTCGDIDVPIRHLRDGVPDSDILIYVSARDDDPFCDEESSISSYATVCSMDQYHRPIVGNIALCPSTLRQNSIRLTNVLIQQVGKILGLSPVLFPYYRNPETSREYGTQLRTVTCVDGSVLTLDVPNILQQGYAMNGRRYYEVVSPTVLQVVRNHFNCQMMSGARLDNSVTSESCFGSSSWDQRYYYGENMSFLEDRPELYDYKIIEITSLSLGLLQDSSWYKPSWNRAVVPSFGHGAGCAFLEGDCLLNQGKILPTYSKEFFCPTSYFDDSSMGCDPSHEFKATCHDPHSKQKQSVTELMALRSPHLPFTSVFQHDNVDGSLSTDANENHDASCPMITNHAISCLDANNSNNSSPFETYGPDSKCFKCIPQQQQSLPTSICLESRCNDVSKTIDIYISGTSQVYQCEHSGQILNINLEKQGESIKIECPKMETTCPNMICPSNCSGNGMCDYTMKYPMCICDDPFDESVGCYGSINEKEKNSDAWI